MHVDKRKAKKINEDIPAIYLALKHPKTPWLAKVLAGLTIVYALSPIDLIPDFIPILVLLDDLIILPQLIALTIKFIPKEELEQCRIESKEMWKDVDPNDGFMRSLLSSYGSLFFSSSFVSSFYMMITSKETSMFPFFV